MKLTHIQFKAVNQLFNKFQNVITNNESYNKTIEFKAPTGAGKTFMIANLITQINQYAINNNENIVYIIATLSSSELPKQMENNLNDYREYLLDLPKVLRYESPSISNKSNKTDSNYHIKLYPNTIYIFGASSFGKNRIYTEYGIYEAFLKEIKDAGYKLVYIRDEAHHGGDTTKKSIYVENLNENINIYKLSTEASFEYKTQLYADYIIKMTATPKGLSEQVIIDEKELMSDSIKLLKTNLHYNEGLEQIQRKDFIDDEELLNIACLKFKEIKQQYADVINEPSLIGINPAMLIQIDDKYANKEKEFKQNLDNIINILEKHNLQYITYFSNDNSSSKTKLRGNYNLKSISDKLSPVDVIIFKIGPATGWNIPRACMLVQLRNVSSTTLNTQVLGRIKRNPNPSYEPTDLFNDKNSIRWNYYIYSNNNLEKQQEFKRVYLKLFNQFENETFTVGRINRGFNEVILNNQEYIEKISKLISDNREKIIEYFYEKKEFELNHKYIIGRLKEIKDNNGNIRNYVEKKINNLIELELFNIEQLQKYKHLIKQEFLLELFNDLKITQLSFQMFIFIIFSHYINEFNEIFNDIKQKSKNKNINQEYILEHKYCKLPVNTDLLITNDKTNNNLYIDEKEFKYAYHNIIERDNGFHYFDSNAERAVFDKLKEALDNIDKFKNNIRLWAKNPVHDGINFEYFNMNDIFNSYPDLIIKYISNKKEHEIIIEIKNEKDIDDTKTENILNSYNEYIKNFLQDQNEMKSSSLTMIVCRWKNNSNIEFRGFSTIDKLNELLNNSSYQNHIKFKNIFEIIEEDSI
ncbi:Type III restriction enzyme, res subunit [Metamycoplasma cloacale]|uniref:Uncharacterized protein n=1 Tax=Metamycoplasma cloacale TaxID=92401 RepID=A0A2Z4LNE4_9BACT|nr:DEAD/DEAH box helicase family protein [Metamycoplasma cloacale]AWX42787.1 hypothetical protein DK849_01775 [Metamycoplasma cloacale]VEU79395.1 Type III restriction enzyme, res subunit [Metamycoplasma cloacale]